jgi:branched-subunit amino acid transport protein AzlD
MVLAMGAVIFSCRAFPFVFFSGAVSSRSKDTRSDSSRRTKAFLDFVGRIVPPAAMTVLTFNALGPSFVNLVKGMEISDSLAVIIAACFTAAVHLLKRNPLISIFGGTAVYMILQQKWHGV